MVDCGVGEREVESREGDPLGFGREVPPCGKTVVWARG